MPRDKSQAANASIYPFEAKLDASSGGATPTLLGPIPAPSAGAIELHEFPYLCLRAFLKMTNNASADGKLAKVNLVYWQPGANKALRAASLTLTAGAELYTGDVLEGAAGDSTSKWYEVDTWQQTAGLVVPRVLSWPDNESLAYFDMLECARAQLTVQPAGVGGGGSNADRVLILAKPAMLLPPRVEIPFSAAIAGAGSPLSSATFTYLTGGSGTLPAAGSGWEYSVDQLISSGLGGTTSLQLQADAAAIFGPLTPATDPAVFALGRGLGAGKQPKVTTGAALPSGGYIEIAGVLRPARFG